MYGNDLVLCIYVMAEYFGVLDGFLTVEAETVSDSFIYLWYPSPLSSIDVMVCARSIFIVMLI